MRVLKIFALALVLTLAIAGIASAKVRGQVRDAAGHAAAVLALDETTATPEAEPSESPEAEAAEPEDADEASAAGNHGAAVSAIAQDESAVGTKVLANGKEITNHGQAVSAMAKSDAGKPEKTQKAGDKNK